MSESSTGQRSRQVLSTGGRTTRLPVGTVCASRGHGMRGQRKQGGMRGFTLVELLVVIGIIVILIGLLIPAIGYVRTASRTASTQSLLAELQGAIERYHMDYRAYPGPIHNDMMYGQLGTGLAPADPNHISNPDGTALIGHVTGSENLALALLGGLRYEGTTITGGNRSHIVYDPSIVGTGPRTLAYDFGAGTMTAKTNQAKTAYIESTTDLSTNSAAIHRDDPNYIVGHFKDGSGDANDSTIPEFVDRYPSPMPILYLRARPGAANVTAGLGGAIVISDVNNVRNAGAAIPGNVQYDLAQYFSYVGSFRNTWPALTPVPLDADEIPTQLGASIGEGKDVEYWYGPSGRGGPFSIDAEINSGRGARHGLVSLHSYPAGNVGDPAVDYPIGAPGYFRNPAFGVAIGPQSLQNQPRAKDSFILISAGPDRVYGTADDITSFGSVMP